MTNPTGSASSTHRLPLPDGRVLAFEEYGRRDGAPVLFLGAAPSSRLLDPDPGATAAADIRLLTVDRPGYGESTPLEAGDAPSWSRLADDLAYALREIGVAKVPVIGWSNGGIGALAFAARHADLVDRVVVAGSPAPHEDIAWIPEEFEPFLVQLRQDPANAVAALAPAMAAAPADAVASLGGGADDERTLGERDNRQRLEAMLGEAYRQGGLGAATDIVATNVVPWGFALGDVQAPVTLLYGASDAIISSAHGEWYASRLPHATLEVLDGTGHLIPLTHWARILEAV